MIIRYVTETAAIVVDEPHDLRRFSVDAAGADRIDLNEALLAAGAGGLADDNAFVPIAFLKAAVGDLREDSEWQASLERMIAFAQTRGWLTSDGLSIQAHIENLA